MSLLDRIVICGSLGLLLSGCGGGSSGAGNSIVGSSGDVCQVALPNYAQQAGQPSIQLLGEKVMLLNVGDQYVEPGVEAFDNEDGELSSAVQVQGLDKLDTGRVGDYLLKYSVADSEQNLSLSEYRMVRIVDGDRVARYSPRFFTEMDAIWEFYEQLPANFGEDPKARYPLLISNHGYEHSKTFDTDGSSMSGMDKTNVVKMLKAGQWDNQLPFIVLAPQRCQSALGDNVTARLNSFVEWAERNYPIDKSRIYMTGFSNGGFMTWDYAQKYGHKLAAAAPLSMGYWLDICPVKEVPIWAFTAADDNVIPTDNVISAVATLKACLGSVSETKLTVFPTGGHLIDDDVYSLGFMGEGATNYDVYDQSLFQWLLQHQKM